MCFKGWHDITGEWESEQEDDKDFLQDFEKIVQTKKTNRGKGNLFSFQCPIPNETNMIVKTFWMPYIIQRKAFLDRFKSEFKKCHCVQFSTIGFADIQISLLLISNLTNLSNSFFNQFAKCMQNMYPSILLRKYDGFKVTILGSISDIISLAIFANFDPRVVNVNIWRILQTTTN